jgi:hypothetical protein
MGKGSPGLQGPLWSQGPISGTDEEWLWLSPEEEVCLSGATERWGSGGPGGASGLPWMRNGQLILCANAGPGMRGTN